MHLMGLLYVPSNRFFSYCTCGWVDNREWSWVEGARSAASSWKGHLKDQDVNMSTAELIHIWDQAEPLELIQAPKMDS